ncbi:unnamed protein product, partial [Mesorhabditis spiculigera]
MSGYSSTSSFSSGSPSSNPGTVTGSTPSTVITIDPRPPCNVLFWIDASTEAYAVPPTVQARRPAQEAARAQPQAQAFQVQLEALVRPRSNLQGALIPAQLQARQMQLVVPALPQIRVPEAARVQLQVQAEVPSHHQVQSPEAVLSRARALQGLALPTVPLPLQAPPQEGALSQARVLQDQAQLRVPLPAQPQLAVPLPRQAQSQEGALFQAPVQPGQVQVTALDHLRVQSQVVARRQARVQPRQVPATVLALHRVESPQGARTQAQVQHRQVQARALGPPQAQSQQEAVAKPLVLLPLQVPDRRLAPLFRPLIPAPRTRLMLHPLKFLP